MVLSPESALLIIVLVQIESVRRYQLRITSMDYQVCQPDVVRKRRTLQVKAEEERSCAIFYICLLPSSTSLYSRPCPQ